MKPRKRNPSRLDPDRFCSLAAAELNGYARLYALDRQGRVWVYVEQDRDKYWAPLTTLRADPLSAK